MDWTAGADNLYKKILENTIANIPHGFKKLARFKVRQHESEIRDRIEEKARERGSKLVEREDIVEAVKAWIPPEKKKLAIRILKDSGVDVNKYFKKTDIFQALY